MSHPNQLKSILMQSIPWLAQTWKPASFRVLLPNFGVNTCPQFWDKMVLFQNSNLLVYRAATILSWDVRITPNFLTWALYNIPIVSLLTHSTFSLSPSFLSQLQQLMSSPPRLQTIANPLFNRAIIQADSNLFRLQWQPLTTSLRYASKSPLSKHWPLLRISFLLKFILFNF